MQPHRLIHRLAGMMLGALAGGLVMTWPGVVAGGLAGGGLQQWTRVTPVTGLGWHGCGFPRDRRIYAGATALLMGAVAKCDGRVSDAEVAVASRILSELQLGDEGRARAVRIFTRGKEDDAPLGTVLWMLRWVVRNDPDGLARFLDYQLRVACADGGPGGQEEKMLRWIWKRLGVSADDLKSRLSSIHGGRTERSIRPTLDHAYRLLGVSPRADLDAVRRAYRRAISQSHPDRLVSKGVSEAEIEAAGERTREIRAAYEAIRHAREVS